MNSNIQYYISLYNKYNVFQPREAERKKLLVSIFRDGKGEKLQISHICCVEFWK